MNRDGLPELLDAIPGPAWATVTDRWEFTDAGHAWRTHSHQVAPLVLISATESYAGYSTSFGPAAISIGDDITLTPAGARALAAALLEAAAVTEWINNIIEGEL